MLCVQLQMEHEALQRPLLAADVQVHQRMGLELLVLLLLLIVLPDW